MRHALPNGPDDQKNALLERAEDALRQAERLLSRPRHSSGTSPDAALGAIRDTLRELEEARHPFFGDTMGLGVDDGPVFPKEREVARIGDMDPRIALRVGLDGDSDVYLSTTGDPGEGVEFCTPGSGGGKSKRTRDALIALMVAIEQDNAEDPGRDWWKRRNDTSG